VFVVHSRTAASDLDEGGRSGRTVQQSKIARAEVDGWLVQIARTLASSACGNSRREPAPTGVAKPAQPTYRGLQCGHSGIVWAQAVAEARTCGECSLLLSGAPRCSRLAQAAATDLPPRRTVADRAAHAARGLSRGGRVPRATFRTTGVTGRLLVGGSRVTLALAATPAR
jgi:hypothetical protein